jgi:hypothetical protein
MSPAVSVPSVPADSGGFGGLGPFVGILLPAVFIIRAMQKLSDPGNSKRCAIAEALVSAGWLLFSLARAVILQSPEYGWMLPRVVPFAGLLMLGGVGMGIAGLREVGATTRPLAGRGQAAGAILLGVCSLGAGIFGFLSGDRSKAGPPEDWWRLPQQTSGTKLTYAEKGFRFTVPTSDWIQVHPNRLHPNADLAFVHARKRTFILVIALNLPPGISVSQEKLAEMSRTEPTMTDPLAVVGESYPETVGTLRGTAFTADFQVDKLPCRQWCWVHAAPKRTYHVVISAPPVDFQETFRDAAQAVRGLELIGP